MRILHLALAGATAATVVACAAKQPTVTYNEPPAERWTGSMQPTQTRSGSVSISTKNKTFGSVSMSKVGMGNMDRMHVGLTLTYPTTSGVSLQWAIVPGRCGSGDLPLIGVDQFPPLEIGSNGRGQVNADVPLDMRASDTYHVNVYLGGQQLDNVVSCGNLKYETPKAP
jgi:hypothetical protein